MAVDTQQLLDDAKCIQTCIPPGMQMPVINSLLGQMAHETDVDEMIAGALCVQTCIPNGMQGAVIISLAEQLTEQIPTGFGTPANLQYSSPGSDGGIVSWDFSGFSDPDHWQLYVQLADTSWVTAYSGIATYSFPGSAREINPLDGAGITTDFPTWNGFIRLVGQTALNADQTNPSAALDTGI